MTRCLNRGVDFDVISILDFRIADDRSATNAQYGHRNRRLLILESEQVRAITVIAIGDHVGCERLDISHEATQCGMPKMIAPWFVEYLLNAGRFLGPHQYRDG